MLLADIDLTAQLTRALTEYRDDMARDVKKRCKAIAKKACQKVADSSPELTEDYRKGWRVKTVESRSGISAVVYNKTDYHLTHLLEFGHAKVDGGRVEGKAHIKPAEREAVREFENAIREAAQ